MVAQPFHGYMPPQVRAQAVAQEPKQEKPEVKAEPPKTAQSRVAHFIPRKKP